MGTGEDFKSPFHYIMLRLLEVLGNEELSML